MDLNSYLILKDVTKGWSAFVCGAGPSLYDAYTSPRFKEMFNHVVISANSSIMAMPWRTSPANLKTRYWISNDSLCIRWSWWRTHLKKAICTKIVRNSWWPKFKNQIEDFLIFTPRRSPENEIDPEGVGLAYCSSVPTGLDLAIFLGCKNIFLLGVDHCKRGKYTHYWQRLPNPPRQLRPAQGPFKVQQRVFPINDLAYKALHGYADIKGVKIYNCNPNSKVEEFEKITFEQAFRIIK